MNSELLHNYTHLCSVGTPSGWSLWTGLDGVLGLICRGASTRQRGSTTKRVERENRSNSDGEIR